MPEVQGTIKHMSKTGKGFVLDQYEQWFNRGAKFEGTWPTQKGDAITITFEQTFNADGEARFWVLEAWPTTGGKPSSSPSPELKPTTGPKPTNGPTPTQPPTGEVMALGPTPTVPPREDGITWANAINAAVECLKANLDYSARKHGDDTPLPIDEVRVLSFARNLYGGRPWADPAQPAAPGDGDPGPEEPA